MDDNGWRVLFRKARGALTPEMQDLHTQRIIKRELVNEYDGLLAELEDEQEEAMLSVCAAARRYDRFCGPTLRCRWKSHWIKPRP